MRNIEKFVRLVNDVLILRLNGKADGDIGFLDKLFKKYKEKDKYKIRIKYLKRMYSVARTLNKHLNNDDWKELFSKRNVKKYKNYEKNVINTENSKLGKNLDKLLEFLETKKIKGKSKSLGSKSNCVVSALSKYGYYHTEANFPIYDTYAEKYIKLLFEKLYTKKQKEELANQTKHKDKYWRHFFRYAMILKCLNNVKIQKFKIRKNTKIPLIKGIDSFVWMYGVMKSAMKKDKIEINNKEPLCYSETCGDVSGFVSWYRNAKIFLRDKDKKRV